MLSANFKLKRIAAASRGFLAIARLSCYLTPLLNLEFLAEHFIPKIRVLGLSVGEDFVILACVVFIQCQRVTGGQTDGPTDNPAVANIGLCIASYADAL